MIPIVLYGIDHMDMVSYICIRSDIIILDYLLSLAPKQGLQHYTVREQSTSINMYYTEPAWSPDAPNTLDDT